MLIIQNMELSRAIAVEIIYNQTNEIIVPEKAVTIQGDSFVYIVNDNIATKKY